MTLSLALLVAFCPQDSGTVTGTVTVPAAATRKRSRLKLRLVGQTGLGKKKPAAPSPAVVYLEGAPASRAGNAVARIDQEGLEFRPRVLPVQVGTTVQFPNRDDLYHNVLSYSPPKRFDLGRYSQGESRRITFDRRGRVDVYCELHEHMRAFIIVVDNPYFAVAGKDGDYTIPNVPPGTYTLVAWHESFKPVRRTVEVKADGTRADLRFVHGVEDRSARRARAGCCIGR